LAFRGKNKVEVIQSISVLEVLLISRDEKGI